MQRCGRTVAGMLERGDDGAVGALDLILAPCVDACDAGAEWADVCPGRPSGGGADRNPKPNMRITVEPVVIQPSVGMRRFVTQSS